MENIINDIKAYLIEFENNDHFVDEGNLRYVLAMHRPTNEELLKIDYIRDFMEAYDFNTISVIEEVDKNSIYYSIFRYEWLEFENVYDFVTSYPWLFRNNHSYEQK